MTATYWPEVGHCQNGSIDRERAEKHFKRRLFIISAFILFVLLLWAINPALFAQGTLPGSDASSKLEAAGTLLRLLDTALFKWGARLFAGLCIFSSAWALKEQRFGVAIIAIVGALVFGTAPTWVKNIFSIGSGDSVFSN